MTEHVEDRGSACTECGSVFDCPNCAAAWVQVERMERELRNYRAKCTRLENDAERDAVRRRDGAQWKSIVEHWKATYPEDRIKVTGLKSARATAYFLRLESEGVSPQDVADAVTGGTVLPYVVYGVRRQSGSKSDRAVKLEDLMENKSDGRFEVLAEAGRKVREGRNG